MTFADRLATAIADRRTPAMVGLDPRFDMLPDPVKQDLPATPAGMAAAYVRFCCEVIDVVAPLVPIVKPQVAFFEQLGPAGWEALVKVVAHARERKLLVLMDAKRGDIGSTAEAYAEAFLGSESPLAGDALTVSPYLGPDTLEPFFSAALKRSAGVFVLVKTSNPQSGVWQDLAVDGQTVYQRVGAHLEGLATQYAAACGYAHVGAVVGATHPEQLAELRSQLPHCWFLVPGYGSQGGTSADVAAAFDERGLGAVVNSSRGILFAHARAPYSQKFGAAQWQRAVEAATHDMIADLRTHTPAGKLG